MNPDGTPLVADPKNMGAATMEAKSFTSEDLERSLAKQKEEHDALIPIERIEMDLEGGE